MANTPRFNHAVAHLATPPISAVQGWIQAYSGDQGPLIDLAQAVPGYPPHEDLLRWLGESAGSAAHSGYGDIEGDPPLREAYARHVSEVYDAELASNNVHITAGCNQAFVAAVMAIAGGGDSILLPAPFYFNHLSTLTMLGIRPELVECRAENGFVPDPDAIAEALHPRVRAVVLVTPNNPTGAVYPCRVMDDIYEVCRRHGAWLLVDETYRDFLPRVETPPHGLFGRPAWEEGFIQLYSFSKSFSIPGHRLGAITAGEAVVGQVAKIMDNLQICPPRPAQSAIARALPALTEWREANRREIIARAETFEGVMREVPQWEMASIGAYFAYVRHPFENETSEAVAARMARRVGVATVPGEYFGEGQARFLRMAFANVGSEAIHLLGPRLSRL